MPSIDPNATYPDVMKYWALVQEMLDTLEKPRTLADALRKSVESYPSDQRLIFYQAEPYSTALDLAGVSSTDERVRQYRILARDTGWEMDTAGLHP